MMQFTMMTQSHNPENSRPYFNSNLNLHHKKDILRDCHLIYQPDSHASFCVKLH